MKQTAATMPSRTPFKWKISLLLGSLGLTLLASEAGTRLACALMHRPQIIVSDSLAGWSGKPNLQQTLKAYGQGRFTISTDAQGRRRTSLNHPPHTTNAATILLLGDSFVQGIGVDDSETFAWALARETSYHIVNLGVTAYGADQELLQLEKFLNSEPGRKVAHVIVIVSDNDFVDTQRAYHPYLARSKPLFQVGPNGLVRSNYTLPLDDLLMDRSRLFWLLKSKLSLLCARPDPPSERGINLVLYCLKAMRELSESRGARFHALIYHPMDSSLPFDRLRMDQFVKAAEAVDITDWVRMPSGADPVGFDRVHWSPAGHRRVAAFIKTTYLPELSGTQ
jgi:hypothetical protein